MVDIPTSVVDAVTADLKELAKRDPRLARSTHAASALALARELDDNNSATSKSMCARALNETMDRLRELAPPLVQKDGVSDIEDQRKKRRAREARASS